MFVYVGNVYTMLFSASVFLESYKNTNMKHSGGQVLFILAHDICYHPLSFFVLVFSILYCQSKGKKQQRIPKNLSSPL